MSVARDTLMLETLKRSQQRIQYAPASAPRSRKADVYEIAASVGYSETAGGAAAKAGRHLTAIKVVAAAAVEAGRDSWLDAFLKSLDEIRTAGRHLTLDHSAFHAIAKADAADDCPRLKYLMDPTVENGRDAIATADRAIIALQELKAGIRTQHPALR